MNEEILVLIEELRPNPYQEREHEDPEAVRELAENILHNATEDFDGLLQIPTVRLSGKLYELAFGHTRLAAFKELVAHGHDRYRSMRVIRRELTDLQMFELGVGENMKRRDLNPMEEAHAIHTYMTEFKKDSVEAGAFFNKSPEAIRGAIRLVNLPEQAQEHLRTGKINVTTARALLMVDKLAGAEKVGEVLQDIEKHTMDMSPMEIIEDALQESDDTEFITHMDWLDAQAFPVKHLRAVTREDLLDILGEEGMFQPETVERLMSYLQAGMEITYADWPFGVDKIEKIRLLANPLMCEKCLLHAVLDGQHYCGFKACKVRKDEAWEKGKTETLSDSLGIPLYAKSDGAHLDLNVHESADKKLFRDRHADLRLMPAKNMWNNFEELNREIKVVVVGATAEKRRKKVEAEKAKQPAKKKEPETDYELEHRLRALARDVEYRMAWEFAPIFATELDGLTNLAVLIRIGNEFNNAALKEAKPNKKAKKADQLKQVRRYVAYCMMVRAINVPWGETKPISKITKDLVKLAEELGVKLPKDWSAQVEKFQAEYESARKDVIEKRKAERK